MQKRSGRPTKDKEQKIKNEIEDLRREGFETSYIIAKTGYSKNTVYKHVKNIDDQIFTNNEISSSKILPRVLYDCDKQADVWKSYYKKRENEVNSYILKNKDVPKHLHFLLFETLKEISKAMDRKWNILGGRNGKNFKAKKDGKQG